MYNNPWRHSSSNSKSRIFSTFLLPCYLRFFPYVLRNFSRNIRLSFRAVVRWPTRVSRGIFPSTMAPSRSRKERKAKKAAIVKPSPPKSPAKPTPLHGKGRTRRGKKTNRTKPKEKSKSPARTEEAVPPAALVRQESRDSPSKVLLGPLIDWLIDLFCWVD